MLSKKTNAYSVNSKGEMFVYHTLPEVTSVTPNTVSNTAKDRRNIMKYRYSGRDGRGHPAKNTRK